MRIYLDDEKSIPSPQGTNWVDFKQTLLTPKERAEIDLRVNVAGKKIEARDARERLALARQAQVSTSRPQAEVRA